MITFKKQQKQQTIFGKQLDKTTENAAIKLKDDVLL